MRLAIIGCGSIGMRHLKNALALGCKVLVCDEDPVRVRAAEDLGAAMTLAFSDGSVLGHEGVDAIIIATPHDRHLVFAEWAVSIGKPLFVEKPLGSLDQIEDWRRLVAQSGNLVTQVGYQCRFHPKARAMKLLFSDATHGSFECHCDMSAWPGRAYGPLMLEASHDIDLALWFGASTKVGHVGGDVFGRTVIELEESPERQASWGVQEWQVVFKHPVPYYRAWYVGYGVDACGVDVEFRSPEELGDQMYVDELKHFLECVQSGRQTDVPLKDGLRVLEVCAEVERLAKCPA